MQVLMPNCIYNFSFLVTGEAIFGRDFSRICHISVAKMNSWSVLFHHFLQPSVIGQLINTKKFFYAELRSNVGRYTYVIFKFDSGLKNSVALSAKFFLKCTTFTFANPSKLKQDRFLASVQKDIQLDIFQCFWIYG